MEDECTRWPGLLQGGQTLYTLARLAYSARLPVVQRGGCCGAQNHGHVTKTCDQLLQLNKNPIKNSHLPNVAAQQNT
jgi:hypothetical protein